jgi:outer membrane protein assembly factor BamB
MVLDWASSGFGGESSPAVAFGKVYVVGGFGSAAARVEAFDAAGNAGCAGTPKTCSPLWTSTSLGDLGGQPVSSPAVVDGVVYVGGTDHALFAFDAAGTTNCSGVPKTCSPLWTSTSGGEAFASPVVSRGRVYVSTGNGALYAFDAAGTTNCSGVPKTCAPLWTAPSGSYGTISRSSPAVANGLVYLGVDPTLPGSLFGGLAAFDADGTRNCSGLPKTCAPLWVAPVQGFVSSSPAVSNGVAYLANNNPGGSSALFAFDATGGTGHCSGATATKTCTPLWTGPLSSSSESSPAVAYGIVWIGDGNGRLFAFDAAGNINCAGTPKTCTPRWSATPTPAAAINFSSPTIANGVVYIGLENDSCCTGPVSLAGAGLFAFDATGDMNCSGVPVTCTPLWSVPNQQVFSSPVVANGRVYVNGNHLEAYTPEKIPPTTAVIIPTNGATLSGTTLLDATASDDVRVSRVEFHLTPGSFHNTLIGVATPGTYGWAYNWNTTRLADGTPVPNGTYTLNSVAYDPAGNVGRSANVTITVKN